MPDPQKKPPPLKIFLYGFLFSFIYFVLPIYLLFFSFKPHKIISLLIYYVANLIIFFYLFKKNTNRGYEFYSNIENIQGELNILNEQRYQEKKRNIALQKKIERYNNLKDVVGELNRTLNLEYVADKLCSIAFQAIAGNKGVCILYLIDNQLNLEIFKSKKEDKSMVVRAKQGDIFDFWVLRHNTPLLVENSHRDFRFDTEKLKTLDTRDIISLISVPLATEYKFLGTLRLDNPLPGFFFQDDLRFLATICDLGAQALGNSELFQKTQELAIHDDLTGLFSKGYFLQRLKDECRRGISKNTVFSLIMLDIDYFKKYNDKFGHTAGDIVLKDLSENIVLFFKAEKPIISRFGGEEFCIILADSDKKKAMELAQKLRLKIEEEKIFLRRQETHITVSMGVATFPNDATADDDLIIKSDRAMYKAKQKGRNQVCSI